MTLSNRRGLAVLAMTSALVASACGAGDVTSDSTVTTTGATTTSTAVALQPEPTTDSPTAADSPKTTRSASTTTTTTTVAPTTTTIPLPDGVLAYNFAAIDATDYIMSMRIVLDMGIEGDFGPDTPEGPIHTEMELSMTMSHSVQSGLAPGTYEITQTFGEPVFESIIIQGDGLVIDTDDPELIDLYDDDQAVPFGSTVTYIVDEDGTILSFSSPELGEVLDPFGGAATGFGFDGSSLFGPILPEDAIEVGDSWVTETEVEFLPGEPLVTTATSTFVAIETLQGVEAHVIETVATIPAIAFSLDDIFQSGELPPEEELVLSIFDDISLEYAMEASETTATVWFDRSSGTVLRQEVASGVNMEMTMDGFSDFAEDAPDGPIGITFDMTLEMTLAVI